MSSRIPGRNCQRRALRTVSCNHARATTWVAPAAGFSAPVPSFSSRHWVSFTTSTCRHPRSALCMEATTRGTWWGCTKTRADISTVSCSSDQHDDTRGQQRKPTCVPDRATAWPPGLGQCRVDRLVRRMLCRPGLGCACDAAHATRRPTYGGSSSPSRVSNAPAAFATCSTRTAVSLNGHRLTS